jgi:hypothetical protein
MEGGLVERKQFILKAELDVESMLVVYMFYGGFRFIGHAKLFTDYLKYVVIYSATCFNL